ncbi:hypothetical protein AWM68_17055 [Fictibacillus phosphorivorans]|uniref:Uncharacterized protein n=1 Tax=Fictibacillus phosphorivorans TaxID=1221500 RepID=A0A163S458_9BACL|nr:hypothetical protein AWM68_17055 [Fictibacillus phosphorivorans]
MPGETPTAQSAEEAHRTPPGKRASETQINDFQEQQRVTLTPYFKQKKALARVVGYGQSITLFY